MIGCIPVCTGIVGTIFNHGDKEEKNSSRSSQKNSNELSGWAGVCRAREESRKHGRYYRCSYNDDLIKEF